MSTDYSGLGGQHVGHGKELAGIGDDGGRLEHLPVCLENPRDGGAWWAAVSGVTESDMTEAT